MTRLDTERAVHLSVLGTTVAVLLMMAAILYPKPLLLVLVMSVGEGVGILSFALFLLAVALELQGGGATAHRQSEGHRAPPGGDPS